MSTDTYTTEVAAKRARRIAIWWSMTPVQRDYDRHVARRIPHGLPAAEASRVETQEYASWSASDDDYGPACSCHTAPPCSYCVEGR